MKRLRRIVNGREFYGIPAYFNGVIVTIFCAISGYCAQKQARRQRELFPTLHIQIHFEKNRDFQRIEKVKLKLLLF